MKKLNIFILFLIASCSTTSTIDQINETNISKSYQLNNLNVLNKTGKEYENIDIVVLMNKSMNKALMSTDDSSILDQSNLKILIVQYEEGNAFGRWLAPGLGKTVLSVETSLEDLSGNVLLQSQVTRSVGAGGGFTIGAWEEVFNDVAEQIVEDFSLYK